MLTDRDFITDAGCSEPFHRASWLDGRSQPENRPKLYRLFMRHRDHRDQRQPCGLTEHGRSARQSAGASRQQAAAIRPTPSLRTRRCPAAAAASPRLRWPSSSRVLCFCVLCVRLCSYVPCVFVCSLKSRHVAWVGLLSLCMWPLACVGLLSLCVWPLACVCTARALALCRSVCCIGTSRSRARSYSQFSCTADFKWRL